MGHRVLPLLLVFLVAASAVIHDDSVKGNEVIIHLNEYLFEEEIYKCLQPVQKYFEVRLGGLNGRPTDFVVAAARTENTFLLELNELRKQISSLP